MDPVALDANYGFRPDELREIFRILEHHENEIRQTWNKFFG